MESLFQLWQDVDGGILVCTLDPRGPSELNAKVAELRWYNGRLLKMKQEATDNWFARLVTNSQIQTAAENNLTKWDQIEDIHNKKKGIKAKRIKGKDWPNDLSVRRQGHDRGAALAAAPQTFCRQRCFFTTEAYRQLPLITSHWKSNKPRLGIYPDFIALSNNITTDKESSIQTSFLPWL